jgi:hypothetical protein
VQNINLLFILQPIIVIVIATALMVYLYINRHFHKEVWLYALIAYGAAIALKYVVQIPTINFVTNTFGVHSVGLGLYYGVQTMVFEVGLAFVFAWYAVSHGTLAKRDAEAYGLGLAFWENAAFLSALSLINLVSYYIILSGNSTLAQTLYTQLNNNAPGLFTSAPEALRSVGLGTLERISSIMIHFAWGYLCVMAAVYRKKRLFLIALPMGFIDFLVPFAQDNVVLFEIAIFGISILSLAVAWFATKLIKNDNNQTALSSS